MTGRPRQRRGTSQAGSEEAFQTAVLQLLAYTGWTLRYHTHNSQRSAPGFPDIVAVHSSRPWILFAELKSAKAKARVRVAEVMARPVWLQDSALTSDQAAWLLRLDDVSRDIERGSWAGGTGLLVSDLPRVLVKVWRDDDAGWADIESTLGCRRGGLH